MPTREKAGAVLRCGTASLNMLIGVEGAHGFRVTIRAS